VLLRTGAFDPGDDAKGQARIAPQLEDNLFVKMNHTQAVRLDGSITFLNFKGNPVFAQGSEIGSVEPSECFAVRWRASPFNTVLLRVGLL
jgi:hypothetical protein